MDAFKANEIERMRLGGNEGWRKFFEEHEDTQMRGLTWDDATIAERYSGEVGEEWKERLTCKVEEREYVPGEKKPAPAQAPPAAAKSGARTSTPLGGTANRSQSPSQGGKAKVDDKYFAKLGADNASRPEDVPPSQGGKYAGFGNMPAADKSSQGGMLPIFDDMQKDPMGAITKGFGWFASTVTKTAKTVNDGYIQPTAKSVCHFPFFPSRMRLDNITLVLILLPSRSLRVTLPSRPSKRLHNSLNRRSLLVKTHKMVSPDLSRVPTLLKETHLWMPAVKTFGTTSPA